MEDKDVEHINEKLDQVIKGQKEQGKRLNRVEKILISDQEAGQQGLPNKVNEIEERIVPIEKFIRYSKNALKAIGTALSFVTTLVIYYGEEIINLIYNVFKSSGKS
jgi:hypothetical protein